MSFSSSSGGGSSTGIHGHRRLGAKVDVVYSLLGMLGRSEGREDMSATLLSMSSSIESCLIMRQSGCLPLLVQLIHAPGQDPETRERAARALHNVIQSRNDERIGRREVRVLRLLEQLRDYCQTLRASLETGQPRDDLERHPGATIAALMKLSFDEDHRHAMCQLGGLHAVAELIEMDHAAHGSECDDQNCITLRRYAGMALTNLTFGDGNNKALLCSFKEFMRALVSQLRSPSDDLRQVTASVLRNLSWRADSSSKQTLREVGAVIGLMRAAMEGRKESTLKSILSALWNLSAHCSTNKVDICAVGGALAFLVDMLSYKAPSKNFAIVENAGGILRNVSSHIAVREDYRSIVREKGCLQVLLRQLRSPSLTVVSNACGALWNLSARCPHDQRLLWDLGAVPMLRSLVHSKHKMISMGSSAALKNLLSARPGSSNLVHLDSTARGLGLPTLPTLVARRQKALEQEIDQNLAETCENIEPSTSPINKDDKFSFKVDPNLINTSARSYQVQAGPSGIKYPNVARSESRESMRSVTSTHSDTIFEKVNRNALNGGLPVDVQMKQQSSSLHSAVGFDLGNAGDYTKGTQAERKYAIRYKNAMPRMKSDVEDLKRTNSTISWATAPDQEAGCSQVLMHSSIEDKLSQTSSCDFSFTRSDNECSFPEKPDVQMTNLEAEKSKNHVALLNGACGHVEKPKEIKSVLSLEENPFCDYAETDLDQTTDFSLRYAERNSDEDEKQSSAYFTCTEQDIVNGDSVKTYCTEGTPSQTSLNSSRATSASDLQEDIRPRSLFRTIISDASDSRIFKSANLNSLTNADRSLEDGWQEEEFEVTLVDDRINSKENSGADSGAASYRSLTVDDEHKIADDSKHKECERRSRTKTNSPFTVNHISEDDDDDDDQGLLAACINIGMQNNRHIQSLRRNSFEEEELQAECNLTRYETSNELNRVDNNVPILPSNEPLKNSRYSMQEMTSIAYDYGKNEPLSLPATEFHTESSSIPEKIPESENAESQTQPSSEVAISGSCESFDSVERSEQALLEFCIQSRIPKVTNDSTNASNTSLTSNEPSTTETIDTVDTKPNGIAGMHVEEAIIMSEENSKVEEAYRRQRDPDAMIASLDRLTATLVQQTEAMRERDSNMKQSLLSDTWNEDSPNDVSFPSISVSAPLIASFKSDAQDEHLPASSVMTDSRIIAEEAIKIAEVVSAEANNSGALSIDIENINPPSFMGSLQSLSASYNIAPESEIYTVRDRGFSISTPPGKMRSPISTSRKKSLPAGVVAKRALNYGQNHTSWENLSQLENVKPPSMMDEVLDMGDMENSMVSVASITSEIADRDQYSHSLTGSDPVYDFVKPVANVLSMTCMRYAESMQMSANNSLSECLENINPPSLFNEVTEMDESTLEGNSETLCNETLCIDIDLRSEEAFQIDRIEEVGNDTDEATTPIPSEYSSAESTPKKRLHRGHLTPKQKRQLAKERYKTYTIAAELVKKEEEDRRKQEQAENRKSSLTKLTPKQRRQEDRNRFQTQVLEAPILQKSPETVKSGIPKFTGKSFSRANERFRTRTIESDLPQVKDLEVHTMLEQNANIVLNTLSETTKGEETLLDCETLSLVSNESGSEHYLQMRFANGDRRTNFHQESRSRIFSYEAPEERQELEESESEDSEKQIPEPKGPRIIKPGALSRDLSLESNASQSEPEIPKAIRGRRKPLYSNPTTRKSTPQSSPSKLNRNSAIPIGRSNTSPIVRATRATTLRQNNNTPREPSKSNSPKHTANPLGGDKKTAATNASKRSSIPQKGSSLTFTKAMKRHSTPATAQEVKTAAPKPLERQGTFTKDEPEVENAPTVPSIASPLKTKIAKPVANSKSLIQKPKFSKFPNSKVPSLIPSKRNPNSSESSIPKKVTTLGQRSNSNSSISPLSQKKTKEATSKIASLWKKVEDSKNKRPEKPDTRKWITTSNGTIQDTVDDAPAFRFFRSSTFEGMPKTISDSSIAQKTCSQNSSKMEMYNGIKYRNSCDLSGIPVKHPEPQSQEQVVFRSQRNSDTSESEIDITKRISRLGSFIRVDDSSSKVSSPLQGVPSAVRTPASAIVPPFNYNPHPESSLQNAKDNSEGKVENQSFKSEIITASARITTV